MHPINTWNNQRSRKERHHSLRPTLQIECSLGGYSHRERCRAPDRIHHRRTRRHGLEGSSHYTRTRRKFSLHKDSEAVLITHGLEGSSHYTKTRRQFSLHKDSK